MDIALITRSSNRYTGLDRYSWELEEKLRRFDHAITVVVPKLPLSKNLFLFIKKWFQWDLEVFFNDNAVWASYPTADIYHITSQNLATLMLFRRPPGKTVITVHDILPWMVRLDRQLHVYRTPMHALFDWLAMQGVKRADQLIAVSDYTKQCLVQHFGIDPDRIIVTLEGVAAQHTTVEEVLEYKIDIVHNENLFD